MSMMIGAFVGDWEVMVFDGGERSYTHVVGLRRQGCLRYQQTGMQSTTSGRTLLLVLLGNVRPRYLQSVRFTWRGVKGRLPRKALPKNLDEC
jgi:hypothetical protein